LKERESFNKIFSNNFTSLLPIPKKEENIKEILSFKNFSNMPTEVFASKLRRLENIFSTILIVFFKLTRDNANVRIPFRDYQFDRLKKRFDCVAIFSSVAVSPDRHPYQPLNPCWSLLRRTNRAEFLIMKKKMEKN
jgi:hypothetical protein